jgi:hypothetical protein
VKAIEERNELFSTGGVHCQLKRRLDGFSSTIGKVRARRGGNWNYLVQLFCKLRHVAVIIIGTTHVNKLGRLFLDSFHDFGMAVSRRTDGDASIAIKEDISVNVMNPNSLGKVGNQFERRSWIRRSNKFGVCFDNSLGFRPWQ